jgi:hypothetical protein
VSRIQKSWKVISGVISSAAPDAAKLAVPQDSDWQQNLDSFNEQIQTIITQNQKNQKVVAQAENFQQQVYTYLDIAQTRNQNVLNYNTLMIQSAKLAALTAQKQAQATNIKNSQSGDYDPTLPEFLTFMQGAYQDIKNNIVQYLYQENQAYNYWSLQNNPFSVADQTVAELAITQSTLDADTMDFVNSTQTPRQPFSDFVVTPNQSDYAQQFTDLVTGYADPEDSSQTIHQISFSVQPDAFAGHYQVIANNFKISIPGATTDGGSIDVSLIHSGRALVMDSQSNVQEFTHEPIFADYTYNTGTGVSTEGGALGGDPNNPEYIGVSPFTTWTVEIVESQNSGGENYGLDLSSVNQIEITFSGQCYPFTPSQLKPG